MLPLGCPRVRGGELRAELAKVALIAAPQLGILFSPSFELGLAARPHKDLPLSHHRHQQSPFDSYERRLAIGLCAGRCGTSGNWLPEYQAASHDSVSRPVLRKSICRRVCAVLLLSPFTHAVYSEPREHGATAVLCDTWPESPVSLPFWQQGMGYKPRSVRLRKALIG